MINKRKILNAINEGIKSGLKLSPSSIIDDSSYINFDDSKVNKVESFNVGLLEQDFVDLGLSVKWAKYNIGATNGNDPESYYGNYYSWGEIKPKYDYSEEFYDQTLYKKYNKNDLHILQPEDDIVTQTYYRIEKFRMPTKEEIEELLDESKIKNEWKENYQKIEGLNGREFISKVNGNSIFIPAAGGFDRSELHFTSSDSFLWSSSLDSDISNNAWNLYFNSRRIYIDDKRFCGFSVRGVCS